MKSVTGLLFGLMGLLAILNTQVSAAVDDEANDELTDPNDGVVHNRLTAEEAAQPKPDKESNFPGGID